MGHGHHHDHGHAHAHAHRPDTRRALLLALVLNGGFLIVEAVAGVMTGSLALLSDAAHMLSDVGALAVALGAAQLARRAPTPSSSYGLARAEILGALINGLALFAACGVIVWEAIERLASEAPDVPGVPVIVVGAIGLVINLGSAWALWRSDRDDLNIRAALAHMLADALGSVAAVIAGVLVLAGWADADAAISLVVVVLVAWSAWNVLRDAGRVLLEMAPAQVDLPALTEALSALDGVDSVHDLHVWSLDGRDPIVTAHIVLTDDARPDATQRRALELLAETFDVHHATLQLERAGGQELCLGCEP